MKKCDVLEEQLKIWLPGWTKKTRKQHQSANGSIGGLGPGGLDSWDPLMKGIVT